MPWVEFSVIGKLISHYRIIEKLGQGGMGEVFLAHDTSLDRKVALKFLPDIFADDPERLARFEREAKLLAALNHPNIAAIHGLEQADGKRFLVMELVEGETLAQRMDKGVPAIDEILEVCRQIAAGVEAAHERGIIHRDLKPANVKITPEGNVKVLDFGLAKAFQEEVSAVDASHSPTLTGQMTRPGMILGTAAYMSPEQAKGKTVDKRADIWAFGVILFEMLTGQRLFEGETASETLAAVLRQDLPWDRLPATVPQFVRTLLARCLDRDPRLRLRDIGEARVAIEHPKQEGGAGPSAASIPAPARVGRERLAWIIAGIALIAAVGIWWNSRSETGGGEPWDRFTQLTDQTGEETWPCISPDGLSIAYASRARGTWDIYVQRIGGRNPILVAGDPARNEEAPAFSPDGKMLAYHVAEGDGGIFLVGATGESPRRLTDKGFHPAWSPDGRSIAYCTERIVNPQSRYSISSLWVADRNGGAPRRICAGDAIQPAWSPSGRRIAYWANSGGQRDLFTIPAAGGIPTPVLSDAPLDWSPAWSPDGRYLYFASDRGSSMNLWRVPVDEASGRALGPPETVTNGVQASTELPSLSSDGSKLVFRARLASENPVAIPFDSAAERLGDPVPLFRRTGLLQPFDISPDGQWLVLNNQGERQEDIFICRTDGSDLRRVTDDFYRDRIPAWSPDGKRIAFYSNRSGRYEIWEIGRDGGGLKKLSDYKEDGLTCPVFSPPGDRMVVSAATKVYEVLMFDPRRPWAEQQLLKLPLEVPGGILQPMTWSSDGLRLAGTIALKTGSVVGMGVYEFATKKVRTFDEDTPSSYAAWLPDSRQVIVMMGDDNHPVLFDVETGRRRELPVKGPVWMFTGGVVVAPDGRTVFAASRQVESDVWMVERSRTSAPNRGR